MLASLPVKRGYYRRLNSTVDVRRCPDAAVGCSDGDCLEGSSGCIGGNDIDHACLPGLTGVFCRLCSKKDHYYVVARTDRVAHCASCAAASGLGVRVGLLIMLTILAVWAAVAYLKRQFPHRWKALAQRTHIIIFGEISKTPYGLLDLVPHLPKKQYSTIWAPIGPMILSKSQIYVFVSRRIRF